MGKESQKFWSPRCQDWSKEEGQGNGLEDFRVVVATSKWRGRRASRSSRFTVLRGSYRRCTSMLARRNGAGTSHQQAPTKALYVWSLEPENRLLNSRGGLEDWWGWTRPSRLRKATNQREGRLSETYSRMTTVQIALPIKSSKTGRFGGAWHRSLAKGGIRELEVESRGRKEGYKGAGGRRPRRLLLGSEGRKTVPTRLKKSGWLAVPLIGVSVQS